MRTVLSALPDTTSVDVGLNFNVVGGKSWALRMVTTGCERQSEVWWNDIHGELTVNVEESSNPIL